MPLAEPALGDAGRLQASLKERIADVRWARPETLHLTVHFFGGIDDEHVATVVDSMLPATAQTAAFAMTLDTLGSFPPRGTPRVLWLGPAGEHPALNALATRCHTTLREAGFTVETRTYRPHCTLGRPRRQWAPSARAAWSASLAEPAPSMRWTATRMVLYDSRSAPGGAVYTEQAVFPFAAR